jgi:hypothetical protein
MIHYIPLAQDMQGTPLPTISFHINQQIDARIPVTAQEDIDLVYTRNPNWIELQDIAATFSKKPKIFVPSSTRKQSADKDDDDDDDDESDDDDDDDESDDDVDM